MTALSRPRVKDDPSVCSPRLRNLSIRLARDHLDRGLALVLLAKAGRVPEIFH